MSTRISAEGRLSELNIALPNSSGTGTNRVAAVRTGSLVFLSGHGPVRSDGTIVRGKVGTTISAEEGYAAARLAGLCLLASLRAEIGSLDSVKRIVKVFGMVNCAPGFSDTPRVIDGCSDLLIEVFGSEVGKHTRSAVGMLELPSDFAVEIEIVAEIKERPGARR